MHIHIKCITHTQDSTIKANMSHFTATETNSIHISHTKLTNFTHVSCIGIFSHVLQLQRNRILRCFAIQSRALLLQNSSTIYI